MRAASVVSVETRREFNEKFKIPAAQYQQKYLNKITTRFLCFICDRELDPYGPDMHADHIVPKESGGTAALSNFLTLCSNCNQVKGTWPIEEAMKRIYNSMYPWGRSMTEIIISKKINDLKNYVVKVKSMESTPGTEEHKLSSALQRKRFVPDSKECTVLVFRKRA